MSQLARAVKVPKDEGFREGLVVVELRKVRMQMRIDAHQAKSLLKMLDSVAGCTPGKPFNLQDGSITLMSTDHSAFIVKTGYGTLVYSLYDLPGLTESLRNST